MDEILKSKLISFLNAALIVGAESETPDTNPMCPEGFLDIQQHGTKGVDTVFVTMNVNGEEQDYRLDLTLTKV